MYPNDPISNLNAANIAISEGKLGQAKRYLAKTTDTPQRQLAEAAICMLENDLDRAEKLLTPLAAHEDTPVAEAARGNLEQIMLKREE